MKTQGGGVYLKTNGKSSAITFDTVQFYSVFAL